MMKRVKNPGDLPGFFALSFENMYQTVFTNAMHYVRITVTDILVYKCF